VANVTGGYRETGEFYRLFMVPGMAHCGGGPGANVFGNFANGPDPSDHSDDLLSALDRWVTQGEAPDQVIATKYVNDTPPAIAFQRPLCPFPEVSKYSGNGDPTQASNWLCVQPRGKRRQGRQGEPGAAH